MVGGPTVLRAGGYLYVYLHVISKLILSFRMLSKIWNSVRFKKSYLLEVVYEQLLLMPCEQLITGEATVAQVLGSGANSSGIAFPLSQVS